MFRYGHFGHGPGVFGWFFLAMFIALIVLAVVALVRSWKGLGNARSFPYAMQRPPHGIDPALAELRVRYARGEIDSDEYAHRAANLGYPGAAGTTGPGPAAPPGSWTASSSGGPPTAGPAPSTPPSPPIPPPQSGNAPA